MSKNGETRIDGFKRIEVVSENENLSIQFRDPRFCR